MISATQVVHRHPEEPGPLSYGRLTPCEHPGTRKSNSILTYVVQFQAVPGEVHTHLFGCSHADSVAPGNRCTMKCHVIRETDCETPLVSSTIGTHFS